MSFILDALKKSETERQRADAPALYEMKMAPPRRGVAVWLIVLAALLVINVIVLSVVLLRGTHGTAPIDSATVATPPPAAPAAPPATTYPTAPTATAPAPAGPANPTLPPAAAAPDTASAASAASTTDAADDAPAIEPPHGNGNGANSNGEVPSYSQAASVPGANLPELKLDLHAYATNPADRFVFLNMTKLKEGQSTPSGVRVESITPDGAILSWQGSRFFLQRQ